MSTQKRSVYSPALGRWYFTQTARERAERRSVSDRARPVNRDGPLTTLPAVREDGTLVWLGTPTGPDVPPWSVDQTSL